MCVDRMMPHLRMCVYNCWSMFYFLSWDPLQMILIYFYLIIICCMVYCLHDNMVNTSTPIFFFMDGPIITWVESNLARLKSWWRHQMETFSALLTICGEFTGHQWTPRTKASGAELWYFLWSAHEYRSHYDITVMVIVFRSSCSDYGVERRLSRWR